MFRSESASSLLLVRLSVFSLRSSGNRARPARSALHFTRSLCSFLASSRAAFTLCGSSTIDDDGIHSGHDGLNLEGVLNADNLIDSVTKSSELLAPVVKLILVHTELHV